MLWGYVGAHNSTYRGEITPVALYFRPVIKVLTPLIKKACPLKRGHFKRKGLSSSPTIFPGENVSFMRGYMACISLSCVYSFSHNHGSGKWWRMVVLEGPIFNFHDYGRKSRSKPGG